MSSNKIILMDQPRLIEFHLIAREFPTWEGGGVSRAPSVARLVR